MEDDGSKKNFPPVYPETFSVAGAEYTLEELCMQLLACKLNIYDIPIAQITEQYIAYLDYVGNIGLQELSEFYRGAARLLYYKTRMMLPVELTGNDEDEDWEESRIELVQSLIEYQRLKKLTELLEAREEQDGWMFDRGRHPRMLPFLDDESEWTQADIDLMLDEMKNFFQEISFENRSAQILELKDANLREEKSALIKRLLAEHGECMFSNLITRRGNVFDVIAAFMAVLGAVGKEGIADLYQRMPFGDIKLCKRQQD
ncbi:MAG: segregation/condensation protein A [Treponema sp.]|nr:segregation/condensation protein A [Treponema sp.]